MSSSQPYTKPLIEFFGGPAVVQELIRAIGTQLTPEQEATIHRLVNALDTSDCDRIAHLFERVRAETASRRIRELTSYGTWKEAFAAAAQSAETWRMECEKLREQLVNAANSAAANAAEIERLKGVVRELEEWKQSAMAVEREWNEQEIASLLGAELGQSCRRAINERVPKLFQENERLTRELREATHCDCGRRLCPGSCEVCDNDE